MAGTRKTPQEGATAPTNEQNLVTPQKKRVHVVETGDNDIKKFDDTDEFNEFLARNCSNLKKVSFFDNDDSAQEYIDSNKKKRKASNDIEKATKKPDTSAHVTRSLLREMEMNCPKPTFKLTYFTKPLGGKVLVVTQMLDMYDNNYWCHKALSIRTLFTGIKENNLPDLYHPAFPTVTEFNLRDPNGKPHERLYSKEKGGKQFVVSSNYVILKGITPDNVESAVTEFGKNLLSVLKHNNFQKWFTQALEFYYQNLARVLAKKPQYYRDVKIAELKCEPGDSLTAFFVTDDISKLDSIF